MRFNIKRNRQKSANSLSDPEVDPWVTSWPGTGSHFCCTMRRGKRCRETRSKQILAVAPKHTFAHWFVFCEFLKYKFKVGNQFNQPHNLPIMINLQFDESHFLFLLISLNFFRLPPNFINYLQGSLISGKVSVRIQWPPYWRGADSMTPLPRVVSRIRFYDPPIRGVVASI